MDEMQPMPADWTAPDITRFTCDWFTSGRMVVQQCASCSTLQHPPEEICHVCGGFEFAGHELPPTGTIHSFTIVRHAVTGALADSLPYAVVLVSLDGAPQLRVVGNMPGTQAGDITIGRAVEAYWEQRGEALIPQWRLTPS